MATKSPKYRIIKHTNPREVYYTLEYRGLLWGWNVASKRIGGVYHDVYKTPMKFDTKEEIYKYLDSLKPEITEVIEEIY